MKQHLISIIDSLSNISFQNNLIYNIDDIELLKKILTQFVTKINNQGKLDKTDLIDYEAANDIIYNLNLDNNQTLFTDAISNEFYAFGYEFQELLKNKI